MFMRLIYLKNSAFLSLKIIVDIGPVYKQVG